MLPILISEFFIVRFYLNPRYLLSVNLLYKMIKVEPNDGELRDETGFTYILQKFCQAFDSECCCFSPFLVAAI